MLFENEHCANRHLLQNIDSQAHNNQAWFCSSNLKQSFPDVQKLLPNSSQKSMEE
jgi:hypothetical protein